jgi:cytosine/adenosine deaminase-related metal-dependent hydrolase
MRTLLEGGDIVAYHDGGHRLLPRGALVFEDDRIVFVGRAFPGSVDRRLDVTGRLVIPGLINLHCHADTEAGGRLIADVGRRDYFQAGFLDYFAVPAGAEPLSAREDRRVGGTFALVEMLGGGCTTVVEIGPASEALVPIVGALGLRAYLSPAYKSATYQVIVDGRVVVEQGRVVGIDQDRVLREAQAEAERLWATVQEWHWQGLTADRLSPLSFPRLDEDLGL